METLSDQFTNPTTLLMQPLHEEISDVQIQHGSTRLPLFSRRGKKEDLIQAKFDASLADAALRQASNSGFFVSPSQNLLLNSCQNDENKLLSLKEIKFVHLTHNRIRTLGHIQSCRYLVICILHNNYLTRFSALENCPFLKRLDLHSNQIVKLPDETFWQQMSDLLVLNLHDNGIGKLNSILPLSSCSNLAALTLYDTPLSLKPNYRHHIVNSIWSLKALDHHVIGDDEIIEDAFFTQRFRSLNPTLSVDLCPKEIESETQRTLFLEMKILYEIISDINLKLRHGSPVIVIQRWIRGYLTRKSLNISYFETITKLKKLNLIPTHTSIKSHAGEIFSLDYDTYLQNRRPGSKTLSSSAIRRTKSPSKGVAILDDKNEELKMKFPPQFHINLEKLERNSDIALGTKSDQNVTIYIQKDSALPAKSLFSQPLKISVDKELADPAFLSLFDSTNLTIEAETKRDAVVDQIPGRLPPARERKLEVAKRDVAVQCGDDPEVPNHEWRIHNKRLEIRGERPSVADLDPMYDHVISNRESGKDVREAIEYWHDCESSSPKRKVVKTKPPSKLKDTVSLATLMAVSKAYRDRDRSDNIAMKVDRVVRIQQERMQSKQIVAAYKDERRMAALSMRRDDRLKIAEAIQHAEANKASYLEQAQERKLRSLHRHQKFNKELLFTTDFSNQHVSVSNALIRHDGQTAKEEIEGEKREIATSIKLQLADQAQMVKRYMEHKQLINQLSASKEKARIEARVAQDSSNRFMQSRQRVAAMKAKKAAIQSYHHSLPPTTNAGLWSLAGSRDADRTSSTTVFKHFTSILPPFDTPRPVSDVPATPTVINSSVPLPPLSALSAVKIDNQNSSKAVNFLLLQS